MKKLALFFSVFLLIFSSCSSDDSEVSQPEEVLTTNGFVLKRVDFISPPEIQGIGGLYSYNGNKLDKVGNSTFFVKYNYIGNLISEKFYYQNTVVYYSEKFNYDANQRLIEHKTLNSQDNAGARFVYTYNTNGTTCTVQLFSGDLISQNNLDPDFNRKLFFGNDGRVTKTERNMIINGNLETLTTAYTYDNKKNPYYSVLGYNKLTLYDVGYYSCPNNLISYTYSATNTASIDVDVIEYNYNSFNFPITSTLIDPFDDSGSDIVNKYFYQQP